ncbi:uncharacterized protein TRUGW13939_11125 [Talaromyces rugulosus]|uniref:Uncharacterized protein n=1 Tax=Talaromyces rugulosus TaxID=121627 RepID=A0A7H8RH96_TALRU|nr:uncharacterized protein TRUGW13939_00187 [Talaromyces rugulosus]XP_035343886.1 uncharacterized protein TRUGW13939_04826 [Talaromyces rugulosus]XP_035349344.1 uncharacterized protein TRUGW13939_10339 [Talaromyces rugulosus]XP_035350127.1 uncharacterized protein TRUGW13939_11125 [Talaromyces rugulosus]QKX53113.1 hypothetical protein TRUGW13939_00187 [Talaromyces rugulosus]QKX57708.1 hypothetical protein TRUGW13939_04826 [Talaromyces rugulosus]QKX63170.1 hypothetical protein TRUGW13939_10339 
MAPRAPKPKTPTRRGPSGSTRRGRGARRPALENVFTPPAVTTEELDALLAVEDSDLSSLEPDADMTDRLESGPAGDATSAPLAENMVEDADETPRHTQAASETPVPVASAPGIPDVLLSGDQPDFSGYYDPQSGAPLCALGARGLHRLTSQESARLARVPPAYFGAVPVADERLVLWQSHPCLRCAKLVGRHQNFCVRRLPTEKCCRCSCLGVKCDSIPDSQLASFRIVQAMFRLGVSPEAIRAAADWVRVVEGTLRREPSSSPSQSRIRSLGPSESDRVAALEARLDRIEGTMGQILQILNRQNEYFGIAPAAVPAAPASPAARRHGGVLWSPPAWGGPSGQ